MKRCLFALCLAIVVGGFSAQGFAKSVLFVSDSTTDTNIEGVLTADGHSVDVETNGYNAATQTTTPLTGSLAGYDAVIWSATGIGTGGQHDDPLGLFANLTSYVNAGGRIFVTGYDSVASPADDELIAFLGGATSTDTPDAPATGIVNEVNSLTTGLYDIRGVTPSDPADDLDQIEGLGGDTTGVLASVDNGTPGWQWTLRGIGAGQIAYVSAGNSSNDLDYTGWVTEFTGGTDGTYNAALRNFVFNAPGGDDNGVIIPTPVALPAGLALLGMVAARRTRREA